MLVGECARYVAEGNWRVAFVWQLALAGCQREERELRLDPPLAAGLDQLRLMPNRIPGTPPEVYFTLGKPYESNAF